MTPPVHVLDSRQSGRRGITAVTALEIDGGLALFDCGPESTFTNIEAALRVTGFATTDVRHVFLSHIHLDHAGAAWRFAERGSIIHVHPRGAAHLLDPSKLVESARRIFGDQMDALWGRVEPISQAQIRIAEDRDVVQLGTTAVRVFATPGHASHHNIYQWDDNVFGGDVAGVTIDGGPPVPPFVPPELHLESWMTSLAVIRALAPARLYLPHFGMIDRAIDEYLETLSERVQRWGEWFRDRLREGFSAAELIGPFAEYEAADLRSAGVAAATISDYECADPSFMAVTAAARYWTKYHPDAITRAAAN